VNPDTQGIGSTGHKGTLHFLLWTPCAEGILCDVRVDLGSARSVAALYGVIRRMYRGTGSDFDTRAGFSLL